MLRGIAALCVAAFHARNLFGPTPIVPHAYLAVDLFFVLSGFILMHRYSEPISRADISPAQFMRFRFARLYPLYLLVTLLGAALLVAKIALKVNHGGTVLDVARATGLNIFVVPDPGSHVLRPDEPLFPMVTPAWSILWEFILSAYFYGWIRSGGRGLGWILSFAVGALIFTTSYNQTLDGGWQWSSFLIGGIRALTGFCLGVLSWRATASVRRSGSVLAARGLFLLALGAALVSGVYLMMVPQAIWPVELALALVAFPVLVCGLALNRSAVLENPVSDLLGGASYSIYLTHGLVVDVVFAAMKRFSIQPSLPVGLGWIILQIAVSWLCWKLFETPCRLAIQRLGKPRLCKGQIERRLGGEFGASL
jgi:peptidoglycan/LPS O-acetylase OafA/YrhL